jgi:hypothetical protein
VAFRKLEMKTNVASTFLLINSTHLTVIHSGGLYSYENSAYFNANFNEFDVQSGALIFRSQKHGNDNSSIPTSDGKLINDYCWEEDINYFSESLYIGTWHQFLSRKSCFVATSNYISAFDTYLLYETDFT